MWLALNQSSASLQHFRVDFRPVRQHRTGCGPAAPWMYWAVCPDTITIVRAV
jgi:hypothetical protein